MSGIDDQDVLESKSSEESFVALPAPGQTSPSAADASSRPPIPSDQSDDDQSEQEEQPVDPQDETSSQDESTMSTSGSTTGGTTADDVFDLATAKTKEEIQAALIVCPKGKRGEKGDKAFREHHRLCTTALDSQFGITSHFIPTVTEGEEGDAHYKNIESMFVGNHDKLEQIKERATKYDLYGAILVPELVDSAKTLPTEKWGDASTKKSLLEHWNAFTVEQVAEFQGDLNRYSSLDSISSEWLRDLLYNSSSPALRAKVEKSYKPYAEKCQQGGALYLKIMLDAMFLMTKDVVDSLQAYLEKFAKKGVAGVPGEAVEQVTKQWLVICERLAEVGELPSRAVVWLLQGLSMSTVSKFKSPFKLLLDQERVADMDRPVGLTSQSAQTLKRIEEICIKAEKTYLSLVTSKEWNVPQGRVNPCWNCDGEGHNVGQCDKPKDQARIDAAKKKYFAERAKSGGDTNAGGQGGAKQGNYERKSWQKGPGAHAAGSSNGVKEHKGVVKMHCTKKKANGKVCGWNCTHTTKYHGAWMANPNAFPTAIPSTHPFYKLGGGGGAGGGGGDSAQGGGGGGTAAASTAQQAAQSKELASLASKTRDIFAAFSKTCSDPDQAAMLEKLSEAWAALN